MGFPAGIKAIDGFIMENPPGPGGGAGKGSMHRHSTYLFPTYEKRSMTGTTVDDIVAMMDEAGIEKAMLEVGAYNSEDFSKDSGFLAVQKYPDRFAGTVTDFSIHARDGMTAVRKLERAVKEFGAKAFQFMPSSLRTESPPNDKKLFPLYAKCIELDIPVCINVGVPGPLYPAWYQDPIHIDEVCWFFPDLKVVMMHGGEPWQFMCVKLMLKWPNLYYMTTAFAPKHYPEEIIYYMNTRGADKVFFATAYPIIDFRRAMTEVKDLPLKDNVWPKFLRENAKKVFKI